MPIDPQVRAFLDALAELDEPPMHTLAPEEARRRNAANAEAMGPVEPVAEYDPLRDEGEAYAARLRDAGVPVTLTRYDGMIHAFFRRTELFDQARVAMQEVADALRQAFA